MNKCQVRDCPNPADLKVTYDCGKDEDDQTCEVCFVHYEAKDENGFEYFKRFSKNVEVLARV